MEQYTRNKRDNHNREKGLLDYTLVQPVYPMGVSQGILPFMAMNYLWE